jgi:hypothetical protein
MQQESDSVQNRLRFLSSFAEPYAQNHFGERAKSVGLAPSKIHHAEPETVLKFLYHHYAFNRSVSPGYNTIAVDAVDAVGAIRSDELWAEFQRRCEDEGWGLNTRVNRGAVRDVAELVQAVGNPFAWAATVVPRENSVRPVYERLVAIQGFGPKISIPLSRSRMGSRRRRPDTDSRAAQTPTSRCLDTPCHPGYSRRTQPRR